TAFCSVFGITSGLRRSAPPRSAPTGSMGQLIDRKRLALKRLTKEQEELAFHPNLVRGPKVIRGVAGSGQTVVLANAVADTLLRAMGDMPRRDLFHASDQRMPKILVLCFNRALAPYLLDLIRECFNRRKQQTSWQFPSAALTVANIDRFAYRLAGAGGWKAPW